MKTIEGERFATFQPIALLQLLCVFTVDSLVTFKSITGPTSRFTGMDGLSST